MLNQPIGPYRIIHLLGEGGMAQVYLAEKGNLGKNVALKVLKREFLYNNHIRGRFLAEAKNMIQLNHPNIVGVQDLIDESDFVAIELEYIEGETLKQYLERKGALPDAEIERLIKQMWSAVSYIHQKGFVHRDIKPSNFMLTSSGVIKLTDFGIAKNMDGTNSDYTGTGTGMVLGTPKYMSPEQVRNTRDVNAQSDIYSLGVVLWEMVTGRVPYDVNTESTFDVFRKIVDEPLSKTNTQWDKVIEKATQKDPMVRVFDKDFTFTIEEEKVLVSSVQKESSNTILDKGYEIGIGIVLFGAILVAWYHFFSRDESNDDNQTEEIIITYNNNTGSFIDSRDGQSYNWVEIGDQVWMSENLNADKFRNGDLIPHAKTREQWTKAGENGQPAWCYVENDAVNGKKYGKLYNWYAVKDPRGLAPKGWHIPTDEEWIKVTNNLGGQEESTGRKMQSTFGWKDNDNGTNESGFSGLPAGNRYDTGDFRDLGVEGSWWSSTEYGKEVAFLLTIRGWFSAPDIYSLDKKSGFNVRCLRD
jgi:uncharacterized protein (TIGR02145 family)